MGVAGVVFSCLIARPCSGFRVTVRSTAERCIRHNDQETLSLLLIHTESFVHHAENGA